jgi:transposase
MRVYLARGVTDMRKGFDGRAAQVQTVLELGPHNGAVFVFRGKRGDLLKALMWNGKGLYGTVKLTTAQLSMLYRMATWTAPPELAV